MLENILNTFIAYVIIVDPVGASMIFNALTHGKPESYAKKMAVRSVVLSTCLVFFFGFFGVGLLKSLGIEIASFKIAGGLLIFYAAFGMITKPEEKAKNTEAGDYEDISVFPLSIPLIAGPGCLTMTVLLFSKAGEQNLGYLHLVITILVVYTITFIAFVYSKKLASLAGDTINNILKRLLGVLLASLAIQFIADGVRSFL